MHTTRFHDLPQAAISFVQSAHKTLHIAVCWFSHPEIFAALEQRIYAGVRVFLIVNYDQVNFRPQGLDFGRLERAGAEVFGFSGPVLLHHKFAVADTCRVISGSWNWTRAQHRDHLLISDDALLAEAFLAEFEQVKAGSSRLHALRNTAPKDISFQQLHQPVWCSLDDIRKRILSGARVWTTAFPAEGGDLWDRCLREQCHLYPGKDLLRDYWRQHRSWDESGFIDWMQQRSHLRDIRPLVRYCLKLRLGDVLVAVRPPNRILGMGMVGSDPEPSLAAQGDFRRFVAWLEAPENPSIFDPALNVRKTSLGRYRGSGLRLVEMLRAVVEAPGKI